MSKDRSINKTRLSKILPLDSVCSEDKVATSVTFSSHFVIHDQNHVIGVLGSIPELGDWNPKSTVKLVSKGNSLWKRKVIIPTLRYIKWKLVLYDTLSCSVIRWEESRNRTLNLTSNRSIVLKCQWGFPEPLQTKELIKQTNENAELSEALESKTKYRKRVAKFGKYKTIAKTTNTKKSKYLQRYIHFGGERGDMEFLICEDDTNDTDKVINELAEKYTSSFRDERLQASLQDVIDRERILLQLQRTPRHRITMSVSDSFKGSSVVISKAEHIMKQWKDATDDKCVKVAVDGNCAAKNDTWENYTSLEAKGLSEMDTSESGDLSKINPKINDMRSPVEKEFNVKELRNHFEELSSRKNNEKERHWSDDYDLLLRRKRVQILKRLMVTKMNSENGDEPCAQYVPTVKNRVEEPATSNEHARRVADLVEDVDQHILDRLYAELRLTDGTPLCNASPRSRMGDEEPEFLCHPEPGSSLATYLDSHIAHVLQNPHLYSLPQAVDTGSLQNTDEILLRHAFKSAIHTNGLSVDDNKGNRKEGQHISKYGNDECLVVADSYRKTGQSGPLSLYLRNKKGLCVTSAACGLFLAAAFAYAKLKR